MSRTSIFYRAGRGRPNESPLIYRQSADRSNAPLSGLRRRNGTPAPSLHPTSRTPAPSLNHKLSTRLKLRVAHTKVAPRARAEHAVRVEGHENRGGHELGRDVQHVERGFFARGVLRAWGCGEERGCRVADDCYAVDPYDGLGEERGGAHVRMGVWGWGREEDDLNVQGDMQPVRSARRRRAGRGAACNTRRARRGRRPLGGRW